MATFAPDPTYGSPPPRHLRAGLRFAIAPLHHSPLICRAAAAIGSENYHTTTPACFNTTLIAGAPTHRSRLNWNLSDLIRPACFVSHNKAAMMRVDGRSDSPSIDRPGEERRGGEMRRGKAHRRRVTARRRQSRRAQSRHDRRRSEPAHPVCRTSSAGKRHRLCSGADLLWLC